MLAALAAGALMFMLVVSGAIDDIDRQLRDLYVGFLAEPVTTNLVIVEVDSASIEAVGR